jgi:DNA-binding GntR family transcriptional regulator
MIDGRIAEIAREMGTLRYYCQLGDIFVIHLARTARDHGAHAIDKGRTQCERHRSTGLAMTDVAPVAGERDPYVLLREELRTGRLLPGQRLVEAELVESLGVSRALVRAALSRLSHEGLLDKEPNRGARVRMVTEDEAVEITQVRAVLEALTAHHAALNATPQNVEEMRALIAQMRNYLGQNDLLAYSECNAKLHNLVLVASGHATAQRLISNLRAQMVRFQYRTILVPGRANDSLAEHTALVDAIAAHNPEQAEAAMRIHLTHVAETLARTKEPNGLMGSTGR